MHERIYDVIIIGGSYAGLSAGLQLARARRNVLVIDEGLRRNRFASHSHGFLTQDGKDPAAIAAEARAQLMAYPTVAWVDTRAEAAQRLDQACSDAAAFKVDVDGTAYSSRRLLLATGVRDILPDIEGLAPRWGKSVFHCPYCHGYALNQGPIGVIAGSVLSMHHGLMLPDWGPTTFLLNNAFDPDQEQLTALAARGVRLERSPIKAISGHADVALGDGRTLSFAGLFALAATELASPIADQLGLTLEEGPLGPIIKTDPMKETSLPGVFACGDAARAMASVALAVGDGNLAGAGLHRSLLSGAI
ncbi:NAD(P)/FAD-dependent oxidoreductase [Oryzifoliimicrobium ureilyticus]|uniref:NAD(P)/FAD-dependent oxidoreductase n=1 Tax=Oryzifoliimicrobium ureilyticus TaxID=3113724 RepID=UPI0030761B6D